MSLGIQIFIAVEVTLCYIPGLLLRLSPFIRNLTIKQKKTLWVWLCIGKTCKVSK